MLNFTIILFDYCFWKGLGLGFGRQGLGLNSQGLVGLGNQGLGLCLVSQDLAVGLVSQDLGLGFVN